MKEKTTGFFAEFKQFIARGNVMDMAVGVIIGTAFKAIVDSLTADIIMPVIGIFVSENTFAALAVRVGGAEITYGNFIQSVLNFLIMALVLFCMVKAMNRFRRKKEEAPAAPPRAAGALPGGAAALGNPRSFEGAGAGRPGFRRPRLIQAASGRPKLSARVRRRPFHKKPAGQAARPVVFHSRPWIRITRIRTGRIHWK